jgi:hypothetical protein
MNHSNSISSPSDEALHEWMTQSPLQEPSPWFSTQTIARIRSESALQERMTLQRLWTSIGALACLLVWVGFEIRNQSLNSTSTLASIELDLLEIYEEIP